MIHRILKLFRWQFHLDEKYGPHSLVWRRDGYRGVTIHELWGMSWRARDVEARLAHIGFTLAKGVTKTPYNAEYHEAHMHTSQFYLETSAPIAFVSFSWWKEDRA